MLYLLHYGVGFGVLVAAVWLAGFALERLALRLDPEEPLRHLARICLGLGAWTVLLFALAATRQLHLGGLLVGLAASLAGASWAWRRDGLALPRLARPSAARVAGALALTAFLLPFALFAMSPPVSWDDSVYHLTLPRLYLEHGGFRPVEMSVYSNWPLGTELLFAAAMLVSGYPLAKLVHLGFGLLVLYALALGCRQLGRGATFAPWFALALFLANDVVLFELRVAYVDLAYAFFFLTGFLFLERARAEPTRAGVFLLLGGLCGGLLVGIKLTGIVGAALLGLMALRTGWRSLTRFAFPVAALWLPWLAKSAWATGNPFYPFLFGGPDWSSALGEQFSAWQRSIGMGRGVLDYLLLPVRVILEGGRGYDRFDGEIGELWIVLVPLALVFIPRSPAIRRLLGVAGLYFLFWALSSQQMRFLIPILPLLALAATLALDELFTLVTARRRLIATASIAVAIALPIWAAWRYLAPGYRLLAVYQGSERETLLESVVPPVFAFIDAELPRDARILMLNTNQGFFCRREYLADSFFEASQIADWLAGAGDVRARLVERGITHVLLDRQERGITFPRALFELLQDPARTELRFRSSDERLLLLRLLPAGERR